MKLLASLSFGLAIFIATAFGLAQPAMADDDGVSIGVKLGPLCVGLCIDGGDHDGGRGGRHRDYDDDDAGFYAHREDYYHQRYDRRASNDDYSTYRDDGYAGYRRHHHARHQAADYEEYNGDDEEDGGDEGED